MTAKPPSVVMEEVTDPEELAKARAQRERFDRNSARIGQKKLSPWPLRPIPRMMAASFGIFPKKSLPVSMRINGEWLLCEDGVVRPVIRGEILASDGSWQRAEFLVDIGADRTVFSAPIFSALRLQARITEERYSPKDQTRSG